MVRMRRVRKARTTYVDGRNLALVIRIRGKHGVTDDVKKFLNILNLRNRHSATFVRLTPQVQKMIKLVEPFITYGYPNLKTVRELITKRGHTKINGRNVALTDNAVIEKALETHNVVCLEDIVHEIYTCGPAFDQVNKFLCSFKLNNPHGGFEKTRLVFAKGGDAGNREENINQLLQKMN